MRTESRASSFASMQALKAPERVTLVGQVAASIKDYILVNDLPVGERLPGESAIADGLGVSKTVVREAIKALEAVDILSTSNGRGSAVGAVGTGVLREYFGWAFQRNVASIIDLLELRKCLEVECAKLAARRRSHDDAQRIFDLANGIARKIDDRAGFIDADFDFHAAIAKAAGNEMIANVVLSLREIIKASIEYGWVAQSAKTERLAVQELHQRVAVAIADQDPELAGREMTAHFDVAIKALSRFSETGKNKTGKKGADRKTTLVEQPSGNEGTGKYGSLKRV